ncbi:MAG: hypothetical protein Pg6C_06510 [Treponemataceae bacterium]|nr:MAG: hypothetical protein Pg6C_06510 [Treponemataceae bacterium]
MNGRLVRFLVFAAAFLSAAAFAVTDDFSDGKTAFSANKPAEAIPLFERALAAQNPSPDIYNYLGLSYYQTGDFAKSLEVFAKGMDAPGANKRVLTFNAGNAAFALEDYKKAEELYSLALSADPDFPDAVLNRANARISQRLWEDSAGDYRRYLELAPDSPQGAAIRELIARLTAQAEEEKRLEALKAVSGERRRELMRDTASRLAPMGGKDTPIAPPSPALE